jgi:hypothetical protein
VPASLHPAIAEQEAANPWATAWTLTWLEGRPRCELGGESEATVLICLSAAGEVEVIPRAVKAYDADRAIVEDDDWLD